MQISIITLDLNVDCAFGEELRTEISAKFRRSGITEELAGAGVDLQRWWTDADGLFGASLSRRHSHP